MRSHSQLSSALGWNPLTFPTLFVRFLTSSSVRRPVLSRPSFQSQLKWSSAERRTPKLPDPLVVQREIVAGKDDDGIVSKILSGPFLTQILVCLWDRWPVRAWALNPSCKFRCTNRHAYLGNRNGQRQSRFQTTLFNNRNVRSKPIVRATL